MTVTTADGQEQQLIVTPDGVVVPATADPAPAKPKAKPAAKRRWLDRFPRPVRWAGLALGVLTAASLVVIVTDGKPDEAHAAPTVQSPAPPAGQLYTELAPPGWSTQAAWVAPIADRPPATDPVTGVTAAITPQDRSTSETAARRVGPKDRWLSVLGIGRPHPVRGSPGRGAHLRAGHHPGRRPGGRPDRDIPAGPVLAVGQRRRYHHRPAVGGQAQRRRAVGADRPARRAAATCTTAPCRPFSCCPGPRRRIALDGAVIVVQPDTGAWWTLRAGEVPTVVTPVTPTSAGTVNRVLAVTERRVVVVWNPAGVTRVPAVIIAAFDLVTGEQDGSTTTKEADYRPGPAFGGSSTASWPPGRSSSRRSAWPSSAGSRPPRWSTARTAPSRAGRRTWTRLVGRCGCRPAPSCPPGSAAGT